ncbi:MULTISPECIES: hypothetical protein [unclassified Frigoribacterium]|jgi:hypothetical protein|uniref:hypothetical protein n=1 Tax=unclassified Frigoribacterium TaxID=2627005 RepID=UPI000F476A15|nr:MULTISPECIES: hypothetical protein [unclassified Frigoribacterium]ROP75155.1 hypothetical protein EDF18_1772 [Frigoribacterium sp. PhB107]ROS57771.1 hypothetical protein EDF50_0107 [Frigoribacterium sp. PhB24]
MRIDDGRPVRVDLGPRPRFIWWGQDVDDETRDAIATQGTLVETFPTEDAARCHAEQQSWPSGPPEALSIVDVRGVKDYLDRKVNTLDEEAALTCVNLADDVRHSLHLPRSRSRAVQAVYDKLVERQFPYLTDDSRSDALNRWSSQELGQLQKMLRSSLRCLETGLAEPWYAVG